MRILPIIGKGLCQAARNMSESNWKKASSIYEFNALDIDGNDVSLIKYKGHVCIIVNVATKCGATDRNYRELVMLYEKYADSNGLRILAFPCNQFGNQEPGSNEDIKQFVQGKYGVKFDMFAKINVNGENAHPLWKYLQMKESGFIVDAIKWNFSKFLIDKNGQPVKRYATTTNPLAMEEDLQRLFAQTPPDSPGGSRPTTATSQVNSGECSNVCSITTTQKNRQKAVVVCVASEVRTKIAHEKRNDSSVTVSKQSRNKDGTIRSHKRCRRGAENQPIELQKTCRGFVCIIVNVATKCGLTNRNYRELVALSQKHADSNGLRILAFPCNQFGNQEPGSNEDIKRFVQGKSEGKFDMFAKINVNGEDAHPLWKYLKMKQPGFLVNAVKWNFTKFLINKEGEPVKRYGTTTNPLTMEEDLEKLFAQ
uniref:Glutathione peroxidase n=1 Tax=Varroa destructor TaxID=109461 RepID=A0A7M7MJC9_VARDE